MATSKVPLSAVPAQSIPAKKEFTLTNSHWDEYFRRYGCLCCKARRAQHARGICYACLPTIVARFTEIVRESL